MREPRGFPPDREGARRRVPAHGQADGGAKEALRAGLVNMVTETKTLLPETEDLAAEILVQAPVAVRMTWEAANRGSGLTEFQEGTRSFLEKLSPSCRSR
ncbi:MAG: hypothetical protein M3P49_14245 [Actinomycetota bacterium]|nr:hypothetical protein [Actinomycetota bacterium]